MLSRSLVRWSGLLFLMSFAVFWLFSVRYSHDHTGRLDGFLATIGSSSSTESSSSSLVSLASSSSSSSSSLEVNESDRNLTKAIEKLFVDLFGVSSSQQQEEECVVDEEIVRQYVPTNPRRGCFPSSLADSRTKARALRKKKDEHFLKGLDTPHRWVIFLHFTHDFDFELFLQTFESLIYNGFSGRIHVVDNSYNCLAANHPFVINHSIHVTTTLAQFNPSQLHNMITMIAYDEGYPFYFWSTTDVVHHSMLPLIAPLALRLFYEAIEHEPEWAIVMFRQERFAVYRTEPMINVEYDPTLDFEFKTCDLWHRLGLAGYKVIRLEFGYTYLDYTIYEMRSRVELDWHNHTKRTEQLEAYAKRRRLEPNFTQRREAVFTLEDRFAVPLYRRKSVNYFNAKYGAMECNLEPTFVPFSLNCT